MWMWNEPDYLRYCETIRATYREAGRIPDDAYPVWPGRATWDACNQMSWPAACAKHLVECRAALGLPPPPLPPTPPVGPLPILRTRGTTLINATTDTVWKQKGVSAFRLFEDYASGRDIDRFCTWAVSRRLNLLRVFQMYNGGIGRFVPYEVPGYYDALPAFLDHVGTFGLSVELVCFADMQTPALQRVDVQAHYADTLDRILGRPGVLLEVCNEPFQNGLDPTTVYHAQSELMQALGVYVPNGGTVPAAQYITVHSPRDDEWPRKGGKDLLELSRTGLVEMPALNIPATEDEPMGIGPEQPGRRSMDPSDHAEAHALCHLFGSGSTIHGDFGIQADLPSAEEDAIVQAIVESWDAVPPACQTWTYTAGHLGTSPLVDTALRTYGMIQGGYAYCVRVRPTAPPVARDGWRIVSERGYQGCVVALVR